MPVNRLGWNRSKRCPEQTRILAQIIEQSKKRAPSVVIFDLDSTLYCNHRRTARIIAEYGVEKGIPAMARFQGELLQESWDNLRILIDDVGLEVPQAEEILKDFKPYWVARFFTHPYVMLDDAMPGAVSFVRALHNAGAYIVYITGRDEPNMGDSTRAKLKEDGFPIAEERSLLILKPEDNSALIHKARDANHYDQIVKESDDSFKKGAMDRAAALGNVVACFDNEPSHINLYYDRFASQGETIAVFLDTDVSPAGRIETLRDGIVGISGFLMD